MYIKDITNILEEMAPLSYQESYDNAGLLTGNRDQKITKTLISLDCTEAVVEEAIQKFAGNDEAHILINNTGGSNPGPAIDAHIDDFRKAFNAHLVCNQILAQALVPGMKKAGYGRIINVISTSVKQPLPNLGVSNTIRGAVASWSKTLAMELGRFNITVNNVLPGATQTGRLEQIIQNKASKVGVASQEIAHEMAEEVPMKRLGEPNEIANAIAFLASPAASYINGIKFLRSWL
jgi:3-oxoacyl-[acyl-carrier protein] reductase